MAELAVLPEEGSSDAPASNQPLALQRPDIGLKEFLPLAQSNNTMAAASRMKAK